MSYYDKYLKYKNKYLQLKNQKGGLRRCELAINDVKLRNMINQPSTAMVHVHGCIIGKKYVEDILSRRNESFIKSTFTIPNNVNIITCSTLNKNISSISDPTCTITSVNDITDRFIKNGYKFFEKNNMSNRPTTVCIDFFRSYIANHFPKEKNVDITDPNAPIHLRNHIYPSDMNQSQLGPFESYHGIEIISNNRSIKMDLPKFRSYDSISGGKKNFEMLLTSELICYLFGVSSLSQTLNLPHLTIILYSCRGYCNTKLVQPVLIHNVDPSDDVFSKTADFDNESFIMNDNYELNDMVLITGTNIIDINSLVGKIISKNIFTGKVTIKGIVSRPELNDKVGYVNLKEGIDKGTNRWSVAVNGISENISFKEENLNFEKRDKIRYEIKLLQNNIFNIQTNQTIKLQNLIHPLNKFNGRDAIVQSIESNRVHVKINDNTFLSVDSSNIDMLPITIDFLNNLRKLNKVNFDFIYNFEYNKNYLYVTDGPNNLKIASSGKVIEYNLYNRDKIIIKDNYSQILKNITLDDIYEVL
jgi:hypothetical protein